VLHLLDDVIHIADHAHLQVLRQAKKVEAGPAHQNCAAFGFQGLQMCDDLFVFAGGELYASIHKNKRTGRYAALGQRIEKHFHQVPAQLWATVTNKATADEKGGRAGSDGTFDRCCGRRRYALS